MRTRPAGRTDERHGTRHDASLYMPTSRARRRTPRRRQECEYPEHGLAAVARELDGMSRYTFTDGFQCFARTQADAEPLPCSAQAGAFMNHLERQALQSRLALVGLIAAGTAVDIAFVLILGLSAVFCVVIAAVGALTLVQAWRAAAARR